MKNIDECLGWNFRKIDSGMYLCPESDWWKFSSYGEPIEIGICDMTADVEMEYPTRTAVFEPVNLDEQSINIADYKIYRGVYRLDEQVEWIFKYMVL